MGQHWIHKFEECTNKFDLLAILSLPIHNYGASFI